MQDQQQTANTTQQAIAAAGGPTKVADWLDVTPSAISQWGTANKVPENRVIELCRMTGGVFQPHQLRPDFFSEGVRV
jgi:DNA-binding transcriptional regulator YdaS (Cro superfamily)